MGPKRPNKNACAKAAFCRIAPARFSSRCGPTFSFLRFISCYAPRPGGVLFCEREFIRQKFKKPQNPNGKIQERQDPRPQRCFCCRCGFSFFRTRRIAQNFEVYVRDSQHTPFEFGQTAKEIRCSIITLFIRGFKLKIQNSRRILTAAHKYGFMRPAFFRAALFQSAPHCFAAACRRAEPQARPARGQASASAVPGGNRRRRTNRRASGPTPCPR